MSIAKNQLDKIKNIYQYVLIDCPPTLGWLTINAFTASDAVVGDQLGTRHALANETRAAAYWDGTPADYKGFQT